MREWTKLLDFVHQDGKNAHYQNIETHRVMNVIRLVMNVIRLVMNVIRLVMNNVAFSH